MLARVRRAPVHFEFAAQTGVALLAQTLVAESVVGVATESLVQARIGNARLQLVGAVDAAVARLTDTLITVGRV